jgi:hypothetical protein
VATASEDDRVGLKGFGYGGEGDIDDETADARRRRTPLTEELREADRWRFAVERCLENGREVATEPSVAAQIPSGSVLIWHVLIWHGVGSDERAASDRAGSIYKHGVDVATLSQKDDERIVPIWKNSVSQATAYLDFV